MFNFFKKKEGILPPDIGKEETDVVTEVTQDDIPVYEEPIEKKSSKKREAINSGNERTSLEFEKINSKVEAINEFLKGFNERFSLINQQIGEVRSMAISNEKNLSKSEMEAQRAVDIVNEVRPDKIRLDYQRVEAKVNTFSEKLDSNKQYMDSIMSELKELKRKAKIFEGTDALLKLNEDVKKDLIELQKMASRVRANTDKSEEIFIEFRKAAAENQKNNEAINNLNNIYSDIKKDVEKIKIERQKHIKYEDYINFRREIENKLSIIETSISELDKIKSDSMNLSRTVEDILSLEKRKNADIQNIKNNLQSESKYKLNEYEGRLFSVLEVLDKIASEINRIKERTTEVSSEITHLKEEKPLVKTIKETDPKRMMMENQMKISDLLLEGGYYLINRDLSNAIKTYKKISEIY